MHLLRRQLNSGMNGKFLVSAGELSLGGYSVELTLNMICCMTRQVYFRCTDDRPEERFTMKVSS